MPASAPSCRPTASATSSDAPSGRRPLDRHDIHLMLGRVLAIAAHDALDRGDVAIVAAARHDDVVGSGEHGVCRVVFHPAHAGAAPRPHPGVHRVGAFEARRARRRIGPQEAADIAGRNAEPAQAGDHDVGKVLAHAVALAERLDHRRIDGGRFLVIAHLLVQRLADRTHAIDDAHVRSGVFGAEGRRLRIDRDARRGGDEMVRHPRRHALLAGDLARQSRQLRRGVENIVAGLPFDARIDREDDLVVALEEGHLHRAVAEEVRQVFEFVGLRRVIEIAGDEPLFARQVGGHQAHDMAALLG